jgi:hypothetical protein
MSGAQKLYMMIRSTYLGSPLGLAGNARKAAVTGTIN